MDLHVIAVIACVFLVSLFSLLFINKFFRGKTFEEVAAEKKLLAEKLYGASKPKRQNRQKGSTSKKDKKEKKQKHVQVTKETTEPESQNDSDAQSDTQSVDSSPSHKKPHVEFSEPEIINDSSDTGAGQKKLSPTGSAKQNNKRKNSSTKPPGTGILVNKSEPVIVKENLTAETLNTFDIKQPKDVLELKKQQKDDTTTESSGKSSNNSNKTNAKDQRKPKPARKDTEKVEQQPPPVLQQENIVHKEIKQLEEKPLKVNDSPKNQNKLNKKKKNDAIVLEKLANTTMNPEMANVNCLMTLLNRAELTRSEIQILIDYLLNKQQDTAVNHSEWSDDIVQKLRKQLNEKEKALQEEQEASSGLQSKLRELRTEINAERAIYNTNFKTYVEDLQNKKMEINTLNQEIIALTDKMNMERQQFQAIRHEKQANSQEFLAQIQQLNERVNLLQGEVVQKNKIINDFQMIVSAARQAEEEAKQKLNEIIQQQNNQILTFEKNIKEAEKTIGHLEYDLELAKMVENDKDTNKVEIRNLQNALDSTKSELNLSRTENNDGKHRIDVLNGQIDELKSQLAMINNKYLEQTQQSNDMIKVLNLKLETCAAEKDEKLSDYEQKLENATRNGDQLMKDISELKEKNNDIRTKNWKLVEALQKAETNAVNKPASKNFNNLVYQPDTSKHDDQQKIRELLQRLFPEAAQASAASALSMSFDQWVEQVAMNVKLHYNQQNNQTTEQISNKSRTNSENHSKNYTENNHKDDDDDDDDGSSNDEATKQLLLENAKLRSQIDELKSLATKTANVLTNLETQARAQDAHWRSIVDTKDEEILSLRNSNGQAI